MTLSLQASGLEQLQFVATRCQSVLTVAWDRYPSLFQRNKVVAFGGELASQTLAN